MYDTNGTNNARTIDATREKPTLDYFTPRSYRTTTPVSELPFTKVSASPDESSLWRVPPVACYEEGTLLGNQLAAHFAAYLRSNPDAIGSGILRNIVRDMDLDGGSNADAAAVGFFEYLEVLLARAVSGIDPFKHLERLIGQYDAAMEAQGYPDAEDGFLERTKQSRLAIALRAGDGDGSTLEKSGGLNG